MTTSRCSTQPFQKTPTLGRTSALLATVMAFAALASSATVSTAADRSPGYEIPGGLGRLHVDARLRTEFAAINGFDESLAVTLRTRLGYGTPQWKGLSAFVEGENVFAVDDDAYFDAASAPNGESAIADPEETELNRAFLQFKDSEGRGTVVGGRQRILLDDHRFVGNVGWRQNEQTFDAVLGKSSFGVDGLVFTYAYLWDVNRIFGRNGGAGTNDFKSNSHVLNASYTVSPALTATVFTYLLDFDNSPGNSSNTFGFRLTGNHQLAEDVKAAYQASYAHQVDAGDNPVDYNANYAMLDAVVTPAGFGGFGAGVEILGSDGGDARFVTPLATAHKFNGFADAFLDNGGVNGLRDYYVYYAPPLPCAFGGKFVYHWFEADSGDNFLGQEIDAVVTRPVGEHVKLVAKFGYFDGAGTTDPSDRTRASLEANFAY